MLLHLTPDAALFVFTLGVLLIYLELNRPGSILPGAAGLSFTLLGIAILLKTHPQTGATILLLTAILLFTLDLRVQTPRILPVVATLALVLGFYLLPSAGPFHSLTALFCGLILGSGTSILTGIARRARASKRLD